MKLIKPSKIREYNVKFLDKTKTPAVEVELSLADIQRLIKTETGRDLIFADPTLLASYDNLIKLIRFPNPIGFAIAANQRIKKGTKLLCYGGEKVFNNLPHDDINYAITATDDYGNQHRFQANHFGDLAALLVHLPDEDFLKVIDINQKDYPLIQMSNTTNVMYATKGECYFKASKDIEPNELIGFSYGFPYWIERMISPMLFKKGTMEILDITTLNKFTVIAALFNKKKGSAGILNRKKNDAQIIGIGMTTLTENCQKLPPPSHLFYQTTGVHVAIEHSDAKRITSENYTSNEKSKNLICFFPVIEVASCEPPPGREIINGKTC